MRLHIGGREKHPDWKIFDALERPEVNFVGNAADLSQFADDSIEAIYASHVLEHFHHSLGNELVSVLLEWRRVLLPNGKLYISVPDLQTLSWLFLSPMAGFQHRLQIMRMMFGGQVDQYDVHKVGFDCEILFTYLQAAKFSDYERVENFELFQDCSNLVFLGYPISLNVVEVK